MRAPKYILRTSCYSLVLCLFSAFSFANSLANQLEGQYVDQTDAETITLVIKCVGNNEIIISDPKGVLINEPITVSIIDKKVNNLAGMQICNYVTSNKDVRFSEINGSITLSLFTKSKAFVGKKNSK